MNEMDDLKRLNSSPIWDQGSTHNIYGFPLPTDQDFLTSGAELAVGIPDSDLYRIGPYFADRSPASHLSPYKWAVDFLVPDGTDVLAARDGQIIQVLENFNEWGPTEEFAEKLNFLTIRHDNGEYSQYCHLAELSVRKLGLKRNDYVKRGQVIARVGKTGWTDRDHLHFIVFKVGQLPGSRWNFYSLKVKFEQ
jgi:murein DD-endopeptidase MepM/ murein hydrolase activator NlpD